MDIVNVQVGGMNICKPSCQYKTVILKSRGCSSAQPLTQAMVSESNVKYVIKYDFYIDDNIRKGTSSVTNSRVSSCVNPAYIKALADYEFAHTKYVVANTNNENIQSSATSTDVQKAAALAALNKAHQVLIHAEGILAATPHYYFYSNAVMLETGESVVVPEGCVVLNSERNAVVSPSDQSGTVYIGSVTPGTYEYTLANIITVPEGCIFDFDGGSINDGIIVWKDTYVINLYARKILSNIIESGIRYTWGGDI